MLRRPQRLLADDSAAQRGLRQLRAIGERAAAYAGHRGRHFDRSEPRAAEGVGFDSGQALGQKDGLQLLASGKSRLPDDLDSGRQDDTGQLGTEKRLLRQFARCKFGLHAKRRLVGSVTDNFHPCQVDGGELRQAVGNEAEITRINGAMQSQLSGGGVGQFVGQPSGHSLNIDGPEGRRCQDDSQ